jgi:hypothetical protein
MLVVEQEKVVDYLLNPFHRYGASKARFFGEFGFRVEEWQRLSEALLEQGCAHDVVMIHETGFGPRYVVDGELDTPRGRRPHVRTVWQLDNGAQVLRLITAYPLETT